jgi:hypothetical protein
LALALVLWGGAASWAGEGAGQAAFDSAKQSFHAGDYAGALALFEQAREQGLGGPAIYYNIAVCHYKLGDFEASASAFQQVARVPGMAPLANYNLGLIELKTGDTGAAADYFSVAARTGDDKIRFLALDQLEKLGRIQPPPQATSVVRRSWAGFASLQAGYDDNVSLVSEDLAPVPSSNSSTFSEFFAAISGPYRPGGGFRFDGSAYLSRFADASALNQNSIQGGLVYRFEARRFRADIGGYYGYGSLDGDPFQSNWLLSARLRWPVAPNGYWEGLLVHEQIEAADPVYEYLEGSRDKVALRGVWRGDVHGVRGTVSYESNDRADPGVSSRRFRIDLRYVGQLSRDWSLELGGSWRNSRFDELTEPRDEDLVLLGLRVNWDLGQAWQIYLEYNPSDNNSSDPAYTYQRNQGFIGANWVF